MHDEESAVGVIVTRHESLATAFRVFRVPHSSRLLRRVRSSANGSGRFKTGPVSLFTNHESPITAFMGRSYYLTTLAAWRKHASRFAHSHYVCLNVPVGAPLAAPDLESPAVDTTQILALIEADEGAHNALDQDADWEQLPHPLSQKPVSENVHRALSQQGTGANLSPGATTFDVAESLGRAHPLLRYRIF